MRSKKLFAPLYAGAQDKGGFQESLAALLSSDHVCGNATLRTGKKPEPTTPSLVDAVIFAAIESGKGIPQRVRTPPHPQRALVTVPVVAQLPRHSLAMNKSGDLVAFQQAFHDKGNPAADQVCRAGCAELVAVRRPKRRDARSECAERRLCRAGCAEHSWWPSVGPLPARASMSCSRIARRSMQVVVSRRAPPGGPGESRDVHECECFGASVCHGVCNSAYDV